MAVIIKGKVLGDVISDGGVKNEVHYHYGNRRFSERDIDPPQELFQNYYEQQRERFADEIDNAKQKIKDIMHESIVEKRKINRLKEMRDSIVDALRESGFLTDLKTAYTHYDIEDYRNDNNCHELSDEIVLERLVLEDLLTDDMQLDRKKIAKHIYEHRKTLSRETIATFYIYAEVSPEIERLLDVLKDYDTKHEVKEVKHEPTIAEAIQAQTEALKEIAKMPKQQFTVYPQAGSTANLGCQMQSPEFKVIPPSTEQQPALESRSATKGDAC